VATYAFDIKVICAVRVEANSEREARDILNSVIDCADVNFGATPNGDPLCGEATIDGDADLFEMIA
jgi:hypothetical protein